MDQLSDIILGIAIVGGLLSGVIGSIVGVIQRYIKKYRELKTKILTGVISEDKVKEIKGIIPKIIGYQIKRKTAKLTGKPGKKLKVVISETAFKVEMDIENPTIRRWLRGKEYSGKEQDKKSLARHLDQLSNVTIGVIMSSDDLREQLFKVLESAQSE